MFCPSTKITDMKGHISQILPADHVLLVLYLSIVYILTDHIRKHLRL